MAKNQENDHSNDRGPFDVAVIGAGPGGYVAAIRAAQLGLHTALIEKEPKLGGTCLRIGCIPSKALLHSSEQFRFVRDHAENHGIIVKEPSVDVAKMLQRKDKVVDQLTGGIGTLMKKNRITVHQGTGKVTETGKIEVSPPEGDPFTLEAKNIILASGSVPMELPNMPKIDEKIIVSSTGALEFQEVPAKMVVIGGGAIGLELGSVWARLGTEVHVVELLPKIGAGFDDELSKALQRSLKKQGLNFYLETKVTSVEVDEESGKATVTAETKNEETVTFENVDRVLMSVGRRAYTDGVVDDSVGVERDDRGRFQVDDHFRTAVDGIYAIGDAITGPMLAHKAEEEGVAVAEIIAGYAGHVNYEVIPNVIYTSPEVAGVGLTEEQAKEKEIDYKSGKFPLGANGRALATDLTDGFVKVIADATTDRILGIHMIAEHASELIAEAVTNMEFHGSAEDLARTVHAHPTLSESIKEAALAVDGRSLHSAK